MTYAGIVMGQVGAGFALRTEPRARSCSVGLLSQPLPARRHRVRDRPAARDPPRARCSRTPSTPARSTRWAWLLLVALAAARPRRRGGCARRLFRRCRSWKEARMRMLIVGAQRLGRRLAGDLLHAGHDVRVLDAQRRRASPPARRRSRAARCTARRSSATSSPARSPGATPSPRDRRRRASTPSSRSPRGVSCACRWPSRSSPTRRGPRRSPARVRTSSARPRGPRASSISRWCAPGIETRWCSAGDAASTAQRSRRASLAARWPSSSAPAGAVPSRSSATAGCCSRRLT